MTAIVETKALAKRYGNNWALRNCTLQLPQGGVIALVGPNGAGKTTLLQLVVGLLRPTEGTVTVNRRRPFEEPAAVLPHVAFVAQDRPLYGGLTADEHLTLGRQLNKKWADDAVRNRFGRLRIPLDRKVRHLSGGQQAQVALGLGLAKQADVVVLDEPLASLDPLARQEFLQTLMEAISETGTTVLLSSHIVAELERTCDYLLIIADARIQLAGDIENTLATHTRVVGPLESWPALSSLHDVIFASHTPRQATAVVRTNGKIFDPVWEVHPVTLEELVLAYLSRSQSESADPKKAMA
jgi:ABC-2 type transport system ATP-binding protein